MTNIDGEKIKNILIDEMITPQTIKIIPNKGMPLFLNQDPGYLLNPMARRGLLKIWFEIEFPQQLTQDQKDALTAVLAE